MGWFGKKKDKKSSGGTPKQDEAARAALKADALAQVRRARADIGEDTLDRIAAKLHERGMVPNIPKTERQKAEETIRNLDRERVADNVRAMLEKGES